MLIFSQMTKMLDLLHYYLEERGFDPCRIDGSIPWEERMVRRFCIQPHLTPTMPPSTVSRACMCCSPASLRGSMLGGRGRQLRFQKYERRAAVTLCFRPFPVQCLSYAQAGLERFS